MTNLAVQLYIPSAPSRGAAAAWVRNVNVWVIVVDKEAQARRGRTDIRNINSPEIVERHNFGTEVDSRYDGPRSKYGQALARAEAFLARRREELAIDHQSLATA